MPDSTAYGRMPEAIGNATSSTAHATSSGLPPRDSASATPTSAAAAGTSGSTYPGSLFGAIEKNTTPHTTSASRNAHRGSRSTERRPSSAANGVHGSSSANSTGT